jgi:hypothetical protein
MFKQMDRFYVFLWGFFVGGITGIIVHGYTTGTLFAK